MASLHHDSRPATAQPGVTFELEWTGPNGEGDYITIVAAGTATWTTEPYVYTGINPSPAKLTAPGTPGAYELWYVKGGDNVVLAKSSIAVSTFVGSVDGPVSVPAGSIFDVAWTGPNGAGDYVTLVKAGTAAWSNEDYFYTTEGSPGKLPAPIEAGAYELWYVSGAGSTVQLKVGITVTPFSASVDGPGDVSHGQPVSIAWTGPAGQGDFITIAAAGSPDTAYMNYCYTNAPSPCIINAPDSAGDYEVRYVTAAYKVLATEALKVK